MAKKNKVPKFSQMSADLKKQAARIAGSESVKFFRESFVKQGFTDSSFKKWDKSNSPLSGKRTLYKSGKLMMSIKKTEENPDRVIIEADSAYAEIHNNGGYITVTSKMKRFFWAKHIDLKKRNKKKAEFCKAMALLKEGTKIKITARQFMGESKTMMSIFENHFKGRIEIAFKQHLNN